MGDFDLANLPQALANVLGLSLFSSQILCCAIFFSMFSLPILILGRESKGSMFLDAAIDFLLFGFFVAVNWLGTWALLMMILLVSGIWALMWKGIGD